MHVQEEAVAENMKNILLVMSSQGILVPPGATNDDADAKLNEALWNETWKRLDRFLPHLFAEVFPEEAKKPKPQLRKSQETNASSRPSSSSASAPQAEPAPDQTGSEEKSEGKKSSDTK